MDPRIGIVFGNVLPAVQNAATGCIPAHIRQQAVLARTTGDKHLVQGMGACMAVRRSVWESLNGFDELLGAGARFQAGEDGDLALRALIAGHWVYETPEVWVTHYGLRSWAQLPALIDAYWRGTGATMVKPLKTRQWQALPLLLRMAGGWALGRSVVGASLGRQRRFAKLWSFGAGFFEGATVAVDKRTGHYVRASGGDRVGDTL